MAEKLYVYRFTLTKDAGEESSIVHEATHHKETGNLVRGKFILYAGNEIVGEIMRAHLKGWTREKIESTW